MAFSSLFKGTRKHLFKLGKSVMKSHRVRIPKYDLPLRFRPWFLVFTCIIMVILAFLGFTNFSRSLPINDKLLHFICFGIATAVFYFIVDVDESARRIWFWRHSTLMFTSFTCFFCGGFLSEVVQATLPYKTFQWGDVLANLCGSTLGLYFSYHVERYHRHRREIARLYQPLSASISELEDDDDDDINAALLLPIQHTQSTKTPNKGRSFANVWDEREELFGIGDSDEENGPSVGPSTTVPQIEGPRIVVSHHS
ncbi:hypothetical protein BDN70DRAFT_726669 [Pholiota conissans]|uniref:VanZ-like domain-containing protein n=1 Tax=Pholiota conissans TaxID=109636 RepID=A0A9P5Z078_9AGAR|nr:hypothetical protein BDN70DRAFT_726669 [Pholiota conissans]